MRRIETRYESIFAMDYYVQHGIWKLDSHHHKPLTKDMVLDNYRIAFLLALTREASGNLGFNYRGTLGSVMVMEQPGGKEYIVHDDLLKLSAFLTGLHGEIGGERLYLNTVAHGFDANYFAFSAAPLPNHVLVEDALRGSGAEFPNVRRLVYMLMSYPQPYDVTCLYDDGKTLIDYAKEEREKTIRDSWSRG